MPPAAKRDVSAILFDVNASNKSEGLAALLKICTFKWLSSTKDLCKLILSNSKESRNAKGYPNVIETNVVCFDPQPVLNAIERADAEKGNWLKGLLLGIRYLKEFYGKPGIITLQILFITDLENCSEDCSEADVNRIIRDLNEYGIYLYIIGPKVKLPYTIKTPDDVSNWMREIDFDESNLILSTAKKIVTSTKKSVICELNVGVNLYFSYKNCGGTQPWKVPLSFGSKLEIPASTVRIYRKGEPFKLVSSASRKYVYVLREDDSVKVEFADLVAGVERHGKFVRIESNDMFKVEGPRNFSIIGFSARNNVPEHYMRGDGAFFVLPAHDRTEDACQAIYNLVDVLAEQKKYAIARRVYNANNKPKYFALIPQPHLKPKCFVMSEIPYADNIRKECKFGDPKVMAEENREEDEEFTQFLNSLDISNKDCKVNIPMSPSMMLDTRSSKLANEAAKKYLKRDLRFNTVDINDCEATETNEYLEGIKAAWKKKLDEEKVEKMVEEHAE